VNRSKSLLLPQNLMFTTSQKQKKNQPFRGRRLRISAYPETFRVT
jgi:hypothetical protein